MPWRTYGTATAIVPNAATAEAMTSRSVSGRWTTSALVTAISTTAVTRQMTRCIGPNQAGSWRSASQVAPKATESQSAPRSELRSKKRARALRAPSGPPPSNRSQLPPCQNVARMPLLVRSASLSK